MGSRPPRMKVRWGCPPRVLSPAPHRTRSWRPCLPGQPWVSGWRSTDRPVRSPRGWTIGFSERGVAHNRVLLRWPFFPEVLEELTKSWMAPFTARSRSSASSILTTLDGVARGYAGIPQVERAIAVHLCPRLTLLYERRKSRRGPSGRRCPPWWSRSAISGSTWQRWRTPTKHAFSTPPSPRQGCSGTPSRASPSSSRRYSSRPRRSSTSWPGVIHRPPLPPGPGLSLPVAMGALLCPPELLRPRPNRHIGWRVEPLAWEQCPPRPSQPPSRPGSRRSGPDAGNPEMLEFALSQETARTAPVLPPVEGREENLLFHFVYVPPLVQGPAVPTFSKKEQFPFQAFMHSAPGLVCSDRPEGRLLSRFDPSATQTVSTVCVRRSGMAVQGPSLRALPVSPCVHKCCRRRP